MEPTRAELDIGMREMRITRAIADALRPFQRGKQSVVPTKAQEVTCGHNVNAIKFSPDCKFLATGTALPWGQ